MEKTNTVLGVKGLKKKKQKEIERTNTLLGGKRLTENKRKRQQSQAYVHESLKEQWHEFILIYSFVLRFLENIERLKTPLENVILQSESWKVFVQVVGTTFYPINYIGNLCKSLLVDSAWTNKFRSFLVCCKTFLFTVLFKTFILWKQSFRSEFSYLKNFRFTRVKAHYGHRQHLWNKNSNLYTKHTSSFLTTITRFIPTVYG